MKKLSLIHISDNSDTFEIARSIKEQYPHIPLVVLTPFSHGITAVSYTHLDVYKRQSPL